MRRRGCRATRSRRPRVRPSRSRHPSARTASGSRLGPRRRARSGCGPRPRRPPPRHRDRRSPIRSASPPVPRGRLRPSPRALRAPGAVSRAGPSRECWEVTISAPACESARPTFGSWTSTPSRVPSSRSAAGRARGSLGAGGALAQKPHRPLLRARARERATRRCGDRRAGLRHVVEVRGHDRDTAVACDPTQRRSRPATVSRSTNVTASGHTDNLGALARRAPGEPAEVANQVARCEVELPGVPVAQPPRLRLLLRGVVPGLDRGNGDRGAGGLVLGRGRKRERRRDLRRPEQAPARHGGERGRARARS